MAEHARYTLLCPQCGAEGIADWWENDGPAYMRKPTERITIPAGFVRGETVPAGPEGFLRAAVGLYGL